MTVMMMVTITVVMPAVPNERVGTVIRAVVIVWWWQWRKKLGSAEQVIDDGLAHAGLLQPGDVLRF